MKKEKPEIPLNINHFKVTNHVEKSYGTSYIGEIELVYFDIVRAIGEPIKSDEYKTSGEWIFESNTGAVFTLYDWKSTNLYDNELPSVKEFRACKEKQKFNIGGNNIARNELYLFLEWIKSSI